MPRGHAPPHLVANEPPSLSDLAIAERPVTGACRPMADSRQPFLVDHRAFAASRAISARLEGVRLAARALPPFRPPCRANFCASDGSGWGAYSASPVARSTMRFAHTFRSRGRLGCFSAML